MTRTISRLSLAALALISVLYCLPAAAQWAWRDDKGRTVYSDQAPPPNIKSEQILRQPSNQTFGTVPGQDVDAKEAAKAGPKTLAEREMELRKRQQERAEADKKQAEEQAQSQARAQECERMRGYLRALRDGQRISRTDAQGNQEILDDSQRDAEIRRVSDGIERSCS